MQVSLPPKLEAFVKAKIESGRYQSADDVVREALRLMQEHDELHQAKLARLREEVAKGEEDFAAGRFDELANDEEIADFLARL